MGADPSVVRRSQRHSVEVRNKKPVQYGAYVTMPLIIILLFMFFGIFFFLLCQFKTGRKILEKVGFVYSMSPGFSYKSKLNVFCTVIKFQKISVLVPSFAHYVYAWMGWGQKPMILTKEKTVNLLSVRVHCCGVAGGDSVWWEENIYFTFKNSTF